MNLKKVFLSILMGAAVCCLGMAKPVFVASVKLVKTLESNKKTDPLTTDIPASAISFDEESNPRLEAFESTKYTFSWNVDMTNFVERIQRAGDKKITVEFLMDSENPKNYQITSITGIETLEEYEENLLKEEIERQFNANEQNGFGRITDEEAEAQREANKKSGLGTITDAEVESEKAANLKGGLGELTNVQVEAQRSANKRKGKGEFTDSELEQKAANKKAGKGDFTDAQLAAMSEGLAEAQKYENKKQWIFALCKYYDLIEANPKAESKPYLDAFNRIYDAILAGNPGPGEYNYTQMYEGWKAMRSEFELYFALNGTKRLKDVTLINTEYNYQKKCYTASFSCVYDQTAKYHLVKTVVAAGYNKSFKNSWSGMTAMWPEGNNVYIEYVYGTNANEEYASNYQMEFKVLDLNGKSLIGDQTVTVRGKDITTVENLPKGSMETLLSGNYEIKLISGGYYSRGDSFIKLSGNNLRYGQDKDAVAVLRANIKPPKFQMIKVPGEPIKMLKTEVYQSLYEQIMESNPSTHVGASLPVTNVSWYDAIYFCNKLSERDGLIPVYSVSGKYDVALWNYTPHQGQTIKGNIKQNEEANGYRLPTLDEFITICRAQRAFAYAGSDDFNEIGWFKENSAGVTQPVGEKKTNAWGYSDLNGNVDEWCWDLNGRSEVRYNRGGNCGEFGSDYNMVSKSWNYAEYSGDYLGFRVVCSANAGY